MIMVLTRAIDLSDVGGMKLLSSLKEWRTELGRKLWLWATLARGTYLASGLLRVCFFPHEKNSVCGGMNARDCAFLAKWVRKFLYMIVVTEGT